MDTQKRHGHGLVHGQGHGHGVDRYMDNDIVKNMKKTLTRI
jgi:hypothetical protein